METTFSGETVFTWFATALAYLQSDILTSANVVYTAVQVPAVVGAGFGAWWLHDFVYPVLEERIRRRPTTEHAQSVLMTFAGLLFPVLWALSLWVSIAVAIHFGWPHEAIWIAINLLVAWIAIRLATMLVSDPFWARTITIVAYTVAALNIIHLLEPTLALLDHLAVSIGRLRISMLTVIQGVISLGILLWAAMLIAGVLERRIQRLPHLTPSIQVLFGKLLKATLVVLAIVVSLAGVGIDLTALAVFSGALGVGIGFGLQKVVSNLLSGIILLMDKSVKPGDIIQIGETYGWVSSLGARYVSVETRDSTEFLIPNEDIITHQVVNWTHQNDLARLKVRVCVSYRADIRKALDLFVQAAAKPARVLKQPAPRALLV
jgi:small-conductance mechanosensitive channel